MSGRREGLALIPLVSSGLISVAAPGSTQQREKQVTIGRQGRIFQPIRPWKNGSHRRTGLDPEPIVDGTLQLLFASQVAFRRLNRNVPQEELNLIEFATGQMT
jgi:hypothetical protein